MTLPPLTFKVVPYDLRQWNQKTVLRSYTASRFYTPSARTMPEKATHRPDRGLCCINNLHAGWIEKSALGITFKRNTSGRLACLFFLDRLIFQDQLNEIRRTCLMNKRCSVPLMFYPSEILHFRDYAEHTSPRCKRSILETRARFFGFWDDLCQFTVFG